MATSETYVLNSGAGDVERDRLDYQQDYFQDILDNQLLPTHITTELASNAFSFRPPRVCELATGSAVWLRDLAKNLPASAELVGMDCDDSKFPPPSASGSLPPNVKLMKRDMYGPFPEDLIGHFDVVHVRMVVLAGRGPGSGVQLARAAMSLLRPGGWLVWVDIADLLLASEPPSPALFRFVQLDYGFKTADRDFGVPFGIPGFLRKAGYVECGEKVHPSTSRLYEESQPTSECLAIGQQIMKSFMRQWLTGFVGQGGAEGMRTIADLEELMAAAEAELSGDTRVNYIFVRAWGRKSSRDTS